MRFVLIVEGETEGRSIADFLRRWLDAQPLKSRVKVEVVTVRGSGRFPKKVVRRAQQYLDAPAANSDVIGVIGLLDFYGAVVDGKDIKLLADPYRDGVVHFENSVGRDRFRMFFAVHETEAWILSQPELLPQDVQTALPQKTREPEKVNFNEPPAKLLDRLYRRAKINRSFIKTLDGVRLLKKLDPGIAADKCPRLKSMLETMLEMAKAAGL